MNNDRRKALRKVAEEFKELIGKLADCRMELETLRDEEQECLDNMPENLQGSDRYQAAEDAISAMDDAISTIEDFEVSDVEDNIENACA